VSPAQPAAGKASTAPAVKASAAPAAKASPQTQQQGGAKAGGFGILLAA